MNTFTGRSSIRDLTGDFTPGCRRHVEERKAELRAVMPLHELRPARTMPQRAIGQALHVKQPAADVLPD